MADLRPIVQGETDWDVDGREPADVGFLEQFVDDDGDAAPSSEADEGYEAYLKVKAADDELEQCIIAEERNFSCSAGDADERIEGSEDVEDAWRSLGGDPRRRRLDIALVFKRYGVPAALARMVDDYLAPTPMPPPNARPSSGSYVTEIHVHFLSIPDRSSHTDQDIEVVRGIVLRYSDGTMTSTGDLRGTKCPGPVILMMGEHIVGVREMKGDDEVVGLSLYATDENNFNRHFEVTATERLYCQEWNTSPPASSSVIVGDGEVLHSLTWCREKNRIDGHTTRSVPDCPNPRDTSGVEEGRVAGCSLYPYNTATGEERDYSWEEYENGQDYMWENLVDENMVSEIEDQFHGVRCQKEFADKCDDVLVRAGDVLNRSNEVHNICNLVKRLSQSTSNATRDECRRELRRQYDALDSRTGHIRSQMVRLLGTTEWSVKYESRAERDRKDIASLKASRKIADVLDRHGVSDKMLLVCAWCPGTKIFDPRHVPEWKRCIHPGCASLELPRCATDHVGSCDACHEPVCAYHLVYTDVHKVQCEKTLSIRCGYRGVRENGKPRSLDTRCCGKVIDGGGKICSGEECEVLCCEDCRLVCGGWKRKCTCMSWSRCGGIDAGCKAGRIECPDGTVFCKACAKENSTCLWGLRCDDCGDRERNDTISDMSDDSDYEVESSESDDDLDVDMDAKDEGWEPPAPANPRSGCGLIFQDEKADS